MDEVMKGVLVVECKVIVEEYINLVGLGYVVDKWFGELFGGMK